PSPARKKNAPANARRSGRSSGLRNSLPLETDLGRPFPQVVGYLEVAQPFRIDVGHTVSRAGSCQRSDLDDPDEAGLAGVVSYLPRRHAPFDPDRATGVRARPARSDGSLH